MAALKLKTKGRRIFMSLVMPLMVVVYDAHGQASAAVGSSASIVTPKPRVIVSTDIGGTDFDDYQSLVHLLMYADAMQLEGLISSPWGPVRNRVTEILKTIDRYAQDYPNLKTWSADYPTPDYLRSITRQGGMDSAPPDGFSQPTDGSKLIIEAAKRPDPRPLWILVWGGIDDLAQALHDDPTIKQKIRVYYIGGPNKKWSTSAYNYIVRHHPDLHIIENNATYRGWFTGGDQRNGVDGATFVAKHLKGHGALGDFFNAYGDGQLKMGDTPSVAYVLGPNPEEPTQESKGGGRFVRAWDRPMYSFNATPTAADVVETYGLVELIVHPDGRAPAGTKAELVVPTSASASDRFPGFAAADGSWHFRFVSKASQTWKYTIASNWPSLADPIGGSFTSVPPAASRATQPSARYPNWWTDNPDPALSEDVAPFGPQHGIKTINQWRATYLADFAARADRLLPSSSAAKEAKQRLFVLTDIGDDPDDQMSMVRLMTYANQMNIEGLVATSTGKNKDQVEPERIVAIVKGYGQVRDNLERHEPGFPSAEALLKTVAQGLPIHNMAAVGEGKDSTGSELLIKAVDRQDDRPLWVAVWGGPNVLAQALWKVRHTRTAEQLEQFVAKLRVYAISDQDDSGPWIRKEFPSLFYIVSPGQNAGGGFHHATWIGIGGDYFHGRFAGADYQLVTNEWLDKNVRSKGPLGAEYPRWKFMMEGDTPSFLNLINNGLSDPEHPEWGGWGGRYELYTPHKERWFMAQETRPIWTNAQDEVLGFDNRWHTTNHATIWRWRGAYQNDFAARMDWTVKPYSEANHPPVPKLDHPATLTVKKGERVQLSAVGSSDPDGDALSYEWFAYAEAGTRVLSNAATGIMLDIKNADQPKAWFDVTDARVMPPGTGTMHIILAVTDHGTPRLTRYKRVIVNVEP